MIEVTAAIIKKEGKILICKRSIDNGGLWEFPGGKREVGESLEECIIREIKEELDLVIEPVKIFAVSTYLYKDIKIYFTVFDAVIITGQMKLNAHSDFAWVSIQEMAEYKFMPADIEFVKKLCGK